jgi:hypothetical protein
MEVVPSAGPLDRMLRFADLAINAAAIPLPIDLGPSLLPHDPIDPATVDNDAARAAPAPAHAVAIAPDDHAPHAVDPAPQDAVAKSLQAAIDAVHHSLTDAGAAPASPHDDGVVASAEPIALADHAPASVDHGAADGVANAHAADATASDLTPAAAPDLAGQAALDAPVVTLVDDALAPLNGLDATLARVVGDTVHEVAQDVNQDVNHATASNVQAADAVSDALDGGSQSHAAAEPLLVPSGTGAVVASSLAGLGTDALAGLLHPATAAAPAPIHAPDPAAAAPHDIATFTAIGLPEVMHADQDQAHQDVAHTASPAAHLVGSGLI